MGQDNTTAGIMKRLVESTADYVDWSKARKVLNVSSHEEAVQLLADALVKARGELAQAKAAIAVIVGSQTEIAIISLDFMGNIVGVSRQGAEILGWPIERLIGSPIDLFLKDRSGGIGTSSDEMARADRGETVSSERMHVRADGTTFSGRHGVYAVLGRGGHATGFIRKIQDLTERKAHEVHIEELDATIALLIG